jgi:hypothetical protein
MLIVALFFDFVYPLTPCVHKPSFMADLHAHREERDPLFFALVMSTVASTLVQLPRAYLPMERHAVRKLAQTCHEASRHITVASYDPPTSMHVVIRYLCVYLSGARPAIVLNRPPNLRATATACTISARDTMRRSTPRLARRRTSPSRFACTRNRRTRGSTSSSVRSAGGRFGCSSVVRNPATRPEPLTRTGRHS